MLGGSVGTAPGRVGASLGLFRASQGRVGALLRGDGAGLGGRVQILVGGEGQRRWGLLRGLSVVQYLLAGVQTSLSGVELALVGVAAVLSPAQRGLALSDRAPVRRRGGLGAVAVEKALFLVEPRLAMVGVRLFPVGDRLVEDGLALLELVLLKIGGGRTTLRLAAL